MLIKNSFNCLNRSYKNFKSINKFNIYKTFFDDKIIRNNYNKEINKFKQENVLKKEYYSTEMEERELNYLTAKSLIHACGHD